MSGTKLPVFSNPRLEAVVENWPSGAKRVTASFKVEINNRGQRVSRITTEETGKVSKPKVTQYNLKMRIFDGDDGKIYLLALSTFGQVIVYPGTMKYPSYIYTSEDNFLQLKTQLEEAL